MPQNSKGAKVCTVENLSPASPSECSQLPNSCPKAQELVLPVFRYI